MQISKRISFITAEYVLYVSIYKKHIICKYMRHCTSKENIAKIYIYIPLYILVYMHIFIYMQISSQFLDSKAIRYCLLIAASLFVLTFSTCSEAV